jgi:uncharacterized protein (TIGR00297 family)
LALFDFNHFSTAYSRLSTSHRQVIHRLSIEVNVPVVSLSLGLLGGCLIGWLAFRAGALSISGAGAAAIVGALVYGFAGLGPSLILILFFLSSSLLTSFKAMRKRALRLGFAKGGRRDIGQVLANGGVATACIVVYGLNDSPLAFSGFIGALAVAAADTWGTEIGVLSMGEPRSLLTGKSVPKGTSGGVSLLGTLATLLGGLFLGILGALVVGEWRLILIGMLAGVLGATFDSLLGATWQVMYFCPRCESATESHPMHHCGSVTTYARGWRWLNNDGVNLISTVVGATTVILLSVSWL